ncbi:MAG: class I SAM-dependent methyltransferase [Desulfatiglandaceae bacterium]
MITIDFDRLPIEPGFRILDVGCGSGRHVGAASRLKGVISIGSDINYDDMVETRKRLIYDEEHGEQGGGVWGIAVSDITSLPFRDDFFDLVICSEVLEHIQDHDTAISEVVRVLKPGKDLAVSVPRYLPERICWALSKEYGNSNGGHIRIYRKEELTLLLESAGVRKWTAHYAHSLHAPYWWLKCLVGPAREDSDLVNLYHSLLVWDMMKKAWITRLLDYLLNPLLGKSMVLYLRKDKDV